ncbi:hypothetical protein GGX14DRAFT_667863 [Mycena pura]|uniref:F-box domain-containing protein n=1 Tax=Mycena pura TaxID=153505 RepID=A0AAD6UYB7_9AGAR|nr:hypothetical protein GGX14DRAFT_667863 [Mycena pura]
MAAASTRTIPIELQEQVLACLHGDVLAMKTCSLVCQAWRPSTRTHLFYTFEVRYDAQSDKDLSYCQDFVKNFLHLAGYIREIDIQDGCCVLAMSVYSSELRALCVLLDHTHSLHRIFLSTSCDGIGSMRVWRDNFEEFRVSFSAVLDRSSDSLTHFLLDGFFLQVFDLEILRGLRHLEYIGLERTGPVSDDGDIPIAGLLPGDSPQLKTLRTLTLYFTFPGPRNGCFVAGLATALNAMKFSRITNLRLGGVLTIAVLEALPEDWLSNVIHLALELSTFSLCPAPCNPCLATEHPPQRTIQV